MKFKKILKSTNTNLILMITNTRYANVEFEGNKTLNFGDITSSPECISVHFLRHSGWRFSSHQCSGCSFSASRSTPSGVLV